MRLLAGVLAMSAALAQCTTLAHSAGSAQEDLLPTSGLQHDVVFLEYPPFSRKEEIVRRTLSPLANLEISRGPAATSLSSQAIDLRHEKFTVYVPRKRPVQGYGVLAFVPPWRDARLPAGWAAAFDDAGVIFVSASKSGNEESIFDRRIPLALVGAYNVMQCFPIDADRVYVGGFSGGARVAMRVALGYPDIFRGAVLNAGSDPIGNRQAVLPPDDLLARFQSSSHIVFLTGMEDTMNIDQDMGSRGSMNAWCVFGTEVETIGRLGHEVATSSAMRRALAILDRRSPVDPDKFAACKARIAGELAADFEEIGHLVERDKPHDAWTLLTKVDARYGGLALPEVIEWEHRIGIRR
jgi:hypothetical protein